jgi:hypothetical protein
VRPLLFLLFLLSCLSGSHPRTRPQQFHAAVQIHIACKDGKLGSGSGTVVGPHRVLTVAHVPLGCEDELVSLTVNGGDQVRHKATLYSLVISKDLAMLSVADDLSAYVEDLDVGPMPEVGDEVCESSGSPRWTFRCGQVNSLNHDRQSFLVSMFTEFGNSGSAVYDHGLLVGLTDTEVDCQGNFQCLGGVVSLSDMAWFVFEE